ncbi:hypothetical protein M426DRAFT_320470 [Hypoxylon sp. CI-4A]|nr:hypothetical protein M426DRAFT_320470 [Hypoxylon sp. CI-4A]
MKIIITGASGFIGGGVVTEAIANERITHIFALTRKPLPESISKNPKVTVIEHQDFLSYTPELLTQLSGAEGVIWTIGGRAYQFKDVETAKKISVDYTVAAAKAFIAELAPKLPQPQKFRFVYCSGKWAEWDQDKKPFTFGDTKRIKGLAEKSICELADVNKDIFEVIVARPGVVVKAHRGLINALTVGAIGTQNVDQLGRGLVKLVLEGHKERILESSDLEKL